MMTIVNSCLSSPNFISYPIVITAMKNISRPCNLFPCLSQKPEFSLSAVAATPCAQIIEVCSENELRALGVTFSGVGDSCVVRMALENGSAANLMLPGGLITSFKAQMWHGGTTEVLHTLVSEKKNGDVVIQGGLSLALDCENDAGVSWSPNAWALQQVNGTPQESIQGRRNSVTVRRNGFGELYIFSPGSEHEWYNKYSFICIGHAALLESIILQAQTVWRGGLHLRNPNS